MGCGGKVALGMRVGGFNQILDFLPIVKFGKPCGAVCH
ncbi:hypothetical protein RISK_003370 [Rhodopirellula islandica]|uniref:Uncharacterized protein n=1 Tax=Rhodopirellula islandica TaxID=595434 RepID=A0A0J1EGC9_RHOIS|nr:hypothetical protein RISK_003370 [Rhodopirellula islandica]